MPAYTATSTTLTNGVISGKWSAGYFLLPASPFHFPNLLCDVQVKTMKAQKNLEVLVNLVGKLSFSKFLVTKHLKWNSPALAACSKANRVLGFLRRSALDTHNQQASKLLYLSLIRSNLACCSPVWAPQAVSLILDVERIQRRATKFTLSLPYRSEVSYKKRILKIGLLPLCYLRECLDLVYVFKCLVCLSDTFISVMNSPRPGRTVSSKGTLLNKIRANTVTFANSFYCRAPRIWNTLPVHLGNIDCSVAHFKKRSF